MDTQNPVPSLLADENANASGSGGGSGDARGEWAKKDLDEAHVDLVNLETPGIGVGIVLFLFEIW